MAEAHALTRSKVTSNTKQVTDPVQGSNISWSLGTTSTLCPQHSTPLSLKVHAHNISKNGSHLFPCVQASSGVWGHLSLF